VSDFRAELEAQLNRLFDGDVPRAWVADIAVRAAALHEEHVEAAIAEERSACVDWLRGFDDGEMAQDFARARGVSSSGMREEPRGFTEVAPGVWAGTDPTTGFEPAGGACVKTTDGHGWISVEFIQLRRAAGDSVEEIARGSFITAAQVVTALEYSANRGTRDDCAAPERDFDYDGAGTCQECITPLPCPDHPAHTGTRTDR
jgi:hypothetical protein